MPHDSSKDPGYSDFMSDAGSAATQSQIEADKNAFNNLTPEKLAAQNNPPTWNDVFNAFNTFHTAQFGRGINRSWTADQDAANAKLAIDDRYKAGLDAWNKAHNSNVPLDTSALGVDAQPNAFTPDKSNNNDFLKFLGLAAGAVFLGPAIGSLFGAGGTAAGLAGAADTAALTGSQLGALGSANEAIAAGMAPGSVGAYSAAAGALSPAELAAAGGTTTLGSMAIPSVNEAVASGMSPGSVGAQAATSGQLTPSALAASQGVVTEGSSLADIATAAQVAQTAAFKGDPSLLQKLQNVTGLNGTQLASLLSGGVNALTAANTSAAIGQGLKAQQEATKASQGVLGDIYTKQLGFEQPYQATGVSGLNQLGELGSGTYQIYDPVTGKPTTTGTGSGYLSHQFNAADLAGGLAPNYDFMLQQGQMANQRAANVGGGALSGNTLQGLNKYTQDYAGTAYQNAFQNYQTQRNNIYNNLSNMAGIGQTANKDVLSAGNNYGTGVVGLNTGLANATAAAMLGQAQAGAGGANSLANSTFLAALLNQGRAQPVDKNIPITG